MHLARHDVDAEQMLYVAEQMTDKIWAVQGHASSGMVDGPFLRTTL